MHCLCALTIPIPQQPTFLVQTIPVPHFTLSLDTVLPESIDVPSLHMLTLPPVNVSSDLMGGVTVEG